MSSPVYDPKRGVHVKNYKTLYDPSDYQSANVSYIFGVPSGEVIDVTVDEIANLKRQRLVIYDNKYRCFVFLDENYREVRKFLNSDKKLSEISNILNNFNLNEKDFKINEDTTTSLV